MSSEKFLEETKRRLFNKHSGYQREGYGSSSLNDAARKAVREDTEGHARAMQESHPNMSWQEAKWAAEAEANKYKPW